MKKVLLMVKRRTLPAKYSAVGYAVWDTRRTIREAENVSRWNPWLAHAWMEEARNELSLDRPFFTEYDAAVERINARWKLLEQLLWFDSTEFWKLDGESYPPTYLEASTD
jgi:hypothetical protein